MIDCKASLSKEEGKFIKRKVDRLLKEFDTLSRGQLYNKLKNITRAVDRSK